MNPSVPANIVYTRDDAIDGIGYAVTAWMTDALPDGSYTEQPDAAWPLLWRSRPAQRGILTVEVADFVAPEAPALWFVRVEEPKASPPAVNLVAFATVARPPGTIVNQYQFATMGVRSEEQVAAVRWYPRDGLVHQVYVAPEWRRTRIGTKVLYTAGALHQSMGWAGKLHSDGRRTPAGDALTSNLPHPTRIAPLTDTMPSMDAPEA